VTQQFTLEDRNMHAESQKNINGRLMAFRRRLTSHVSDQCSRIRILRFFRFKKKTWLFTFFIWTFKKT